MDKKSFHHSPHLAGQVLSLYHELRCGVEGFNILPNIAGANSNSRLQVQVYCFIILSWAKFTRLMGRIFITLTFYHFITNEVRFKSLNRKLFLFCSYLILLKNNILASFTKIQIFKFFNHYYLVGNCTSQCVRLHKNICFCGSISIQNNFVNLVVSSFCSSCSGIYRRIMIVIRISKMIFFQYEIYF